MPEQGEKFEGWAIVEMLGHKKLAGYLSEQAIGGGAIRVMVTCLRDAFAERPVLLSQLSGTGVMVPHNLHLGTAPYLTGGSR